MNVLGETQLEIAKAFFRTTTVAGDTLNGFHFERGPETGAPLLVDLPYSVTPRLLRATRMSDGCMSDGC